MTLRRPLTVAELASQQSFESAKNKLIKKDASTHASFMKLFRADKSDLLLADVDGLLQFYLEALAPHLHTFKDVMTFIKVFTKPHGGKKTLVDNIILYTLRQCYSLYQDPSQYRQVLCHLIGAKYSLLKSIEDYHLTQATFEFVSRSTVPDITSVDTAIINGKSILHIFELQLKRFPADQDMPTETTKSISHIAQTNAVITTKILLDCTDVIKFTVSFRGKLTMLKFLHEYDRAYIHACDCLQTSHDEGRYLTVRFAKLIFPMLTSKEEKEAVVAEIPEAVREFYRYRLERIKPYIPHDNKPQSIKPSLRLYERHNNQVSEKPRNTPIKHGSRR